MRAARGRDSREGIAMKRSLLIIGFALLVALLIPTVAHAEEPAWGYWDMELTMHAPATFMYYKTALLTGHLDMDWEWPDGVAAEWWNDDLIEGRTIIIQQSKDGGKSWWDLAAVQTGRDGEWAYVYNPLYKFERNHMVRAVFRDFHVMYNGVTAAVLDDVSATASIGANVFMPAPTKSIAAPMAGKAFSVMGYVKPRFAVGTVPARMMFYKRNTNGSYTFVKSVGMRAVSNTVVRTNLRGAVSLPKGAYRMRLYYGGVVRPLSGFPFSPTYGSNAYFIVK